MSTNETAAPRGLGNAAGKSSVNTDSIPPQMSGRELLEDLAASVNDLCSMVAGWRSEVDRLRSRVDELERRVGA